MLEKLSLACFEIDSFAIKKGVEQSTTQSYNSKILILPSQEL